MTSLPPLSPSPRPHPGSGLLLGVLLWGLALPSLAHGGHDHGTEFEGGSSQATAGIVVDPATIDRLDIRLEAVTSRTLEVGLQTTGAITLPPDQGVRVNAPINGSVIELLVQPGDAVVQGQALVILLAPALTELRVASEAQRTAAEADLRQAEANMTLAQRNYERQQAIAQGDIAAAQTQVTLTDDRYQRDQELLAAGAIARQQLLASEAAWREAQSHLTRAQSREAVLAAAAERDRATAALDAAQTQVGLSTATYRNRLQQLNSPATPEGRVTVVAPRSGTVAERWITLGEAVEEAVTPLLTLVSGDRLQVTAQVFEQDLAQVALGQGVRARVTGLPDRLFKGQVTLIAPAVDPVSRTVPVTLALENPGQLLKPGMFAELEILSDRSPRPVITLPTTALIDAAQAGLAPDRALVFVQNGDTFVPITVTLGPRSGGRVVVTQGLFEGDQVVVQGALQLYGESLRPRTVPDDATARLPEAPSRSPGLLWAVGGAIALGSFGLGFLIRRPPPPPWSPPAPAPQPVLEKTGVD
ncbi:efflux RND transporter periplasmic adaptor subunit [Prochlorothrix hollandica]|uniref:efflux RND transporter periplasmic adaptor subunit n=1 Tax=Prochlorothrix hollandica TaxID=1223 RepID=UPI000348D3CB|nr:efflux RND transporter periplasmic adaptor subunit [Prochlorothrix hollandica]